MKRVLFAAFFGVALSSCGAGGNANAPTPPLNAAPGGSGTTLVTILPAHYAVVDLGAWHYNGAPVINNHNHVAGTTSGGNVFYYDGAIHVLAPGSASDINDNDVIVGGDATGAIFHLDGSVTHLTTPPGYQSTYANAINNAGQFAATAFPGCLSSLALYSSPGSSSIVVQSASAVAINDSGMILYNAITGTGSCTNGDQWPTVYPGNTPVPLADWQHGSFSPTASDINQDGYAVGYYNAADQNGASTGTASFLFHDGVTQEIQPPGGLNTTTRPAFAAFAVNDANWVTGYARTTGSAPQQAYVWVSGAFTNLNALIPAGCNWVLQNATDVNDEAYIVGTGTYNGAPHQFLLVPQP